MKNKSYIWVSLVVLIFGIIVVPKIIDRVKKDDIVRGERLDGVENKEGNGDLYTMGKAPAFALIDQNNKKITNADYAGKVYVLEFFFTTCPTICPRMNQNMLLLQEKFFGNPNFGIASITINPETDTPDVLKSHGDKLGVKSSNWHMLTGEREYIYKLANQGFNVYVGKTKADDEAGFEHSGSFALIDKNGNIRCRKDEFGNPIAYYDGIEKEGIKAIMQDIAILLKE
ncbi:MAG: SCO family protein [Proteobacteria bacterium]|nr:MAG: SCO family protein [Pseudomonadota bacterium]